METLTDVVTWALFGVTVAGLNMQLDPLGRPEQANDTSELKPPPPASGVTVTV